MIIDIHKIPPEGSTYKGEDPAEALELDRDPLIQPDGPIVYDLFVEYVSHELIVRGSLKASIRLVCAKCGEFFSTTTEVSSFLRAYELPPGADEVNLVPDIREDVLLSLPNYPDCQGANPRCEEIRKEGLLADQPKSDNRWGTLDNLDLP